MKDKIVFLFEKYISGEATEREKKELLNWLSENQELREWLYARFMSSPDRMDNQQKTEILRSIHKHIKQPRTVTMRLSKLLKVAAVIIFPLLIATFSVAYFLRYDNVAQYLTVEAQRGQKTNITLPDGSKVFLNSESELIYGSDFNQKERRLKLVGEAYFEVAQNKEAPFIVDAGQISVYAIGTAFNISSYGNNDFIRTTLTEGKIKVVSPQQTIFLNPDEQADLNKENGTLSVKKLDDAKRAISWLDNQLYFENATFTEIASTLSRIYNIDIHFSSESLKNQRFSGSINNNSLESVFRILSLTSPIRYEIKEGRVELYEIPQQMKYFQ